jgi:hypothetical protein
MKILWEPPTMQNRQLPPCSKSRRHWYPTDYWNTAQALTNQRQQLKLDWSLVSARPTARGVKMRAPRHIGTIHGYAIKKRTPALLTTSQTGSARERQQRHHSPVTAALSIRVLLCWETTARLYQKKNALFRATVSADSQPASRYAARCARCRARCSAGKNKNARSPFSPASRYAARSARCSGRCSAGQKEERSIALFRATDSADLLRIVRGCRGKYRHPTIC